jgi:hypothetical protein
MPCFRTIRAAGVAAVGSVSLYWISYYNCYYNKLICFFFFGWQPIRRRSGDSGAPANSKTNPKQ